MYKFVNVGTFYAVWSEPTNIQGAFNKFQDCSSQ